MPRLALPFMLTRMATLSSLPKLALVGSLLLLTAPLLRAEITDPNGFQAESLEMNAKELAELLGYTFNGVTWHFTAPTYVRLKVWLVQGAPSESPKDPEQSLPPTQVIDMEKPVRAATLRLLAKDKEDAGTRGQVVRSTKTVFKLTFGGQEEAGGDPANKGNSLQELASTLMGKKLADKAALTRSWTYTYTLDLTSYGSSTTFAPRIWLNAPTGGEFKLLRQIGELVDQPNAEAKVRALVAEQQAEAEKKMLAEPLTVYSNKGESTSGKDGKTVQERASFVVVLESSRQPFPPDKAKASPSSTP